jgi:hypothetical protein
VNYKGDVPMDQESALGEQNSDADISAIGHKAGRGLRRALSGTVLVTVGSFAMGLVLVRLIDPDDFGLYAVALAANTFLIHVNNMGVLPLCSGRAGWRSCFPPEPLTQWRSVSPGAPLFWVAAPQLAGSPEATPLFAAVGAGLSGYSTPQFSKFIASARRGEVQE